LAVLLHGCTVVVGVSKLCGVERRAPPIFGRAAVTHWPTFLVLYRVKNLI